MLLRITYSFILLLTTTISFGQTKKMNSEPLPTKRTSNLRQAPNTNARSAVPELVIPTIFQDTAGCGNTLVTFITNEDNWGFVSGMNGFGDAEKAQLFNYDGTDYEVLAIDVFFDAYSVVGDGDVFVKIYEVDETTSGPGALVGTSNPLKMSELQIDSLSFVPTEFTFSDNPKVTGNQFFASVDLSNLYSTRDTLSIGMTNDDCGIAGETWELFGDGETWASYASEASWNIQSNLFMFAVVDQNPLAATKDLLVGNQRIQLHDAFPNPASEELIIDFEMDMKAEVRIEIYALDGQLVQQIDKKELIAGKYQERISIAPLPVGTYFYGITTDKGRLMNKFVIGR